MSANPPLAVLFDSPEHTRDLVLLADNGGFYIPESMFEDVERIEELQSLGFVEEEIVDGERSFRISGENPTMKQFERFHAELLSNIREMQDIEMENEDYFQEIV